VRSLSLVLLLCSIYLTPCLAQSDESPLAAILPSSPENRHLHTARLSIAPNEELALPKLEHESVVVSLSPGRLDRRPTVGQPETLDLVPGSSFAVRGSSTDQLTNVSGAPIDLLLLELRDSYAFNQTAVPRSARDPIDIDPHHIRLELENENVRVLHVHLKPRESTEESQFGMRLEIPLTDSLARDVSFDGKTSEKSITAGAYEKGTWLDQALHSDG
jgi:hypothetical protein